MSDNQDGILVFDDEQAEVPKIQSEDRSKPKGPAKRNNEKVAGGSGSGKRISKPIRATLAHAYQTRRHLDRSKVLYVVIGTCILVIGLAALYASSLKKTPWSPVPEAAASFEPTPVSQSDPISIQPPEPINTTSTGISSNENPIPTINPNAIIDVPGVGLRNAPDIMSKTVFSSLKRGERVEIIKRVSGKGPSWVKIKTKSGKAGWVIASVVKERKGG